MVLLPSAKFSEALFLAYVDLNQVKSEGELIQLFISAFLKDCQMQSCIMTFCNW